MSLKPTDRAPDAANDPRPLAAVNDFVVKFGNVNGSGSASANQMFAKAIFRMGIPVAPKNIFPSNIQGLPTWFEVRVSEEGYLGRREGVDLMVAMNAQTYDEDVASIRPGGYLLYDSSFERSFGRSDITVIGIPLTRLCQEAYTDPRQRQLFKNVAYLGALTALIELDVEAVEGLIGQQFRGKEKLIEPNVKALHLGRTWALENLSCPIGLRLEQRDATGDSIVIDGNAAAGLACVYAGATVCAWYPITPSTSVAEAYEKYAAKFRVDKDTGVQRYAVVQAEDELAAVGMAIGASWNGARAFTATSGPGISLMSEFLGLAYFAEIPLVLFDIQRGGPSTGMPTRTQQSDILACAYASHGDTKHVLLFPSTPAEVFDLTVEAFDLAERIQTPVIMLSDLDLGMNEWMTAPLSWDEDRTFDRGKVKTADMLDAIERYGRYLDSDGDAIPYRTYPGTHPDKGAFFTRGTSHDEYAGYTEDGRVNAQNMRRLTRKFETAKTLLPKPVLTSVEGGSDVGILYFGTTEAAMCEALSLLAGQDVTLDTCRVRAFPFGAEVEAFLDAHETVFVVEQNRDAQMRTLLMAECDAPPSKLVSVLNFDGSPITAQTIAGGVLRALGAGVDSVAAE